MSVYDKARELGEMILETKEGKRLFDARFVFSGDDEAKKIMMEYNQFRSILQGKVNEGSISEEDFKVELAKLNQMGKKAEENPVVAELMASENEFNKLVGTVLDILKQTVLKDENSDGCTGSCSSCGGCH